MTWEWHWRQDDYVIKIKLKNNNKTNSNGNKLLLLFTTKTTDQFTNENKYTKVCVRLSRWECRFTYDELMKFTMISFSGLRQSPRIHSVNNIIVSRRYDAKPSRPGKKVSSTPKKHTQHHVRMEIRTPTPLNSIRSKWSFYNRYKLHCNAVNL